MRHPADDVMRKRRRVRLLVQLAARTHDKGTLGFLISAWAINRADLLRLAEADKIMTPRRQHRRNLRARAKQQEYQ